MFWSLKNLCELFLSRRIICIFMSRFFYFNSRFMFICSYWSKYRQAADPTKQKKNFRTAYENLH